MIYTYTFKCKNCYNVFSKEMHVQKYLTTTIHVCPKCKSRKTVREYHAIPTIYVGEGFTKSVKPGDGDE